MKGPAKATEFKCLTTSRYTKVRVCTLRVLSKCQLNTDRLRTSTASPGSRFQHLITLTVKDFFLMSSLVQFVLFLCVLGYQGEEQLLDQAEQSHADLGSPTSGACGPDVPGAPQNPPAGPPLPICAVLQALPKHHRGLRPSLHHTPASHSGLRRFCGFCPPQATSSPLGGHSPSDAHPAPPGVRRRSGAGVQGARAGHSPLRRRRDARWRPLLLLLPPSLLPRRLRARGRRGGRP